MQLLPSESIRLPFRLRGVIQPGECVEFRALETGSDLHVKLEAGSDSIIGLDAGVGRYGLHTLVFCSSAKQDYAVTVEALANSNATTARFAQLQLPSNARSLKTFESLAEAFAEQHHISTECDSGDRFAASAAEFDAVNDYLHATIAWNLAARCSALGLERDLAEKTFRAADEHLDALKWTRARVVLLNNHALFIAAENVGRQGNFQHVGGGHCQGAQGRVTGSQNVGARARQQQTGQDPPPTQGRPTHQRGRRYGIRGPQEGGPAHVARHGNRGQGRDKENSDEQELAF